MKKILITGYNGFVGKNLIEKLSQKQHFEILKYGKGDTFALLKHHLDRADYIFHLAGINRPKNEKEFFTGNTELTKAIIDYLVDNNLKPKFILSSSTQALLDNPYGRSKLLAELEVLRYGKYANAEIFIYRLPNLFGKWAKPNYNSVVATFLYNISHELDITISDPHKVISLAYIDDVTQEFLKILDGDVMSNNGYCDIEKTYEITLEQLSKCIYDIKNGVENSHEIYSVLSKVYKFYSQGVGDNNE